jgi:hypothetical protein
MLLGGCREIFNPLVSPDTNDNILTDSTYTAGMLVTYPKGGERFFSGRDMVIRYKTPADVKNLTIELYLEDSSLRTIVYDTPNGGLLSWYIPISIAPSDKYRIKISNSDNPAYFSFSNPFIIERGD